VLRLLQEAGTLKMVLGVASLAGLEADGLVELYPGSWPLFI
jgi:hypothetical protein